MIKGTIQQEVINLINIYAPNIGTPKYIKQILMDIKREIGRYTVIVGDFNTPLTSTDRSSRQKINEEETAVLNDMLRQMDLIDIFRSFHPKTAQCTYYSSAHWMFSKIDHMFGHKTSLSKFKKTEIISSIFSDHNAMELAINHKKNTENDSKTWELNNMLLNNEWVNNEIKEEIKRYLETNENEDTKIQNLQAILKEKFIALQAYHKNKKRLK